MMYWGWCLAASALGIRCKGSGEVALDFGRSGRTVFRVEELARASRLAERRMAHGHAMDLDGERIDLTIDRPGYLDAKEKQGPEWWKMMLGRVLQSTCGRFWRQLQFASYLELQGKTVWQFSRHVIAATEEVRGERTEAERAAIDRLHVHMARELLAQNRRLFVRCDDSRMHVHFGDQDRRGRHTISKNRDRIEKVIFYFWTLDETDKMVLQTMWRWIRFTFPRARNVVMETLDSRGCLCVLEAEAAQGLESADIVEFYRITASSSIESISLGKLPSMKGIKLFSTSMDSGGVRTISQCKIEALVLEFDWNLEKGTLHKILRGEIGRGLKSLRVVNAEYLSPEDVWALGELERVEEIDLEGTMSGECLRAMSESSRVAEVLVRASLKMQMWSLDGEAVTFLCRIGVDELEIRDGSVGSMALLLLQGAGSRLAEHLCKLEVWMHRKEWVAETVNVMPFARLEHLSFHTLSGHALEGVCETFGCVVRNRVDALSLQGSFLGDEDGVFGIAEFRNLEELKLTCCKLRKGDIARIVAGAGRLKRLVLDRTTPGTGMTVEDAEAIAAMENLEELAIFNCRLELGALEMIVGNKEFVHRLTRLELCLDEELRPLPTTPRLAELGLWREKRCFKLDTGTVQIAPE